LWSFFLLNERFRSLGLTHTPIFLQTHNRSWNKHHLAMHFQSNLKSHHVMKEVAFDVKYCVGNDFALTYWLSATTGLKLKN